MEHTDQMRPRFLLKVDGHKDAPDGIGRPRRAADWENGLVKIPSTLPLLPKGSSWPSRDEIAEGDTLYIWVHENTGGEGMRATAVAAEFLPGKGKRMVRLRDVTLVDSPFGNDDIAAARATSPLLRHMRRQQTSHAWLVSPDDQRVLDRLIADRLPDSHVAVRRPMVPARELSPPAASAGPRDEWEDAVRDFHDAILAAAEERKLRLQKARPAQAVFRTTAMLRHDKKCVVTRTSIEAVLEAAHVIPHTGHPVFERPDNSLILRRDIHALFDDFLISIHPKSGKLVVDETLKHTAYGKLAGRVIDHKLAVVPLRFHFAQFNIARS
ncbi:MAG: HNH endonuclease [Maritimibacter sp.]|nr:HNH endonuclease [Maritimibacter sp.]